MPQYSTVNGGHMGANQDLSITGVIGTLGTADVGGTALPLPISVDPATGAMYSKELGTPSIKPISLAGSVFTTVVAVGTTVTALPTTVLTNRRSFIAYNVGSSTVFIGGADMVGTGNPGIPILSSSFTPSFDLGTTVLYGVGTITGGTIVTLEVS